MVSTRQWLLRVLAVLVTLGLAPITMPGQAAVGSSSDKAAVTASVPFTVATYNVRRTSAAGGPRWTARRTAAVRVARRLGPDVLALQEAAAPPGQGLKTSPARYLARKLGLEIAPVGRGSLGGVRQARPDRVYNGQYILFRASRFDYLGGGIMILRRGPNREVLNVMTYAQFRDKRSGRDVYVSNTHLSHGADDAADRVRAEETRSMLSVLAFFGITPANPYWVHVGDFNTHVGRGKNRPVKILTRAGLVNAVTVAKSTTREKVNTFNGYRRKVKSQGRHLDYVWVPRGTQVSHWGQAVNVKRGRYAGRLGSDHNPIAATLTLPSL